MITMACTRCYGALTVFAKVTGETCPHHGAEHHVLEVTRGDKALLLGWAQHHYGPISPVDFHIVTE